MGVIVTLHTEKRPHKVSLQNYELVNDGFSVVILMQHSSPMLTLPTGGLGKENVEKNSSMNNNGLCISNKSTYKVTIAQSYAPKLTLYLFPHAYCPVLYLHHGSCPCSFSSSTGDHPPLKDPFPYAVDAVHPRARYCVLVTWSLASFFCCRDRNHAIGLGPSRCFL